MYATLVLAVLLACWLAHRGGLARYGLVLVGLVLVLPDPGAPLPADAGPDAGTLSRRRLARAARGRAGARAALRQPQQRDAVAGARRDGLRADGRLSAPDPPARYDRYAAIGPLLGSNELRPQDAGSFRRLLRDTHTTIVAVEEGHIVRFAAGLAAAGLEEDSREGGVIIYRVPA